ncbi:ATP-binding cassette domain-containing protein [Flavobacterium sp. WW92]|uniref:ABC-F family ATP-binding cassette domain-containing protein n=1 Tax=unclassified Flavobacterium TaxID=196869 RepID=UPI0022244B4A|nr:MULTISPECIES: ABC-F family ATP-binding cassette domain-containing protein [unclassified Flavobacterium]WDO12972.1 ATP-binding cassette domain-containing protein [Flavobacterium sp. WW92]
MLILHNISYLHPSKDLLFAGINLNINNHDKVALIGNNGSGKSTLLKIIAGELEFSGGQLHLNSKIYHIPQIYGQYDELSVAQALKIEDKLNALKNILNGNVTEENLTLLDDDWTIEECCTEALQYWNLKLELTQKMSTLSGGQKTKVMLAGISIHQPDLVLMDEPSNHLDTAGRELLYHFIRTSFASLLIVSHDRKLLNLVNTICELQKDGIAIYGGNYDFYSEQKAIENNVLNNDIRAKEKELRKAREKEREVMERKQKLDARGKKKQEKSGVARIVLNTLKNNAENSTSKIKGVHTEKIGEISQNLKELRFSLPAIDKIKMGFADSSLHKGKILFSAKGINFSYDDHLIWKANLNFEILSGERIAIKGSNGSGKTTLIKIILGKLKATLGTVYHADKKSIYIDQDYSLIDNSLSVYLQAQQFNTSGLQEHDIKTKLNSFLFTREDWDKPCNALSGGERMRLLLCCLTIDNQPPDLIVLDEPTNNLDIQNIEILTTAINQYQGTLLVISHDNSFLEQINAGTILSLD